MRDRVLLGLLLAAGVGFGSVALAGVPADTNRAGRTVEVSMQHSRFLMDESTFESGEAVTFVLRNQDPIDHEFILGAAQLQLEHESGTDRYHQTPTEVTVPALATVRTTVIMPSPGALIVGCHLPGHYAYGMRAEITVE